MLMINNGVIEVIENLFIGNQPFLIRITTWGQTLELRASKQEINNIIKHLETFTTNIEDTSEDTIY